MILRKIEYWIYVSYDVGSVHIFIKGNNPLCSLQNFHFKIFDCSCHKNTSVSLGTIAYFLLMFTSLNFYHRSLSWLRWYKNCDWTSIIWRWFMWRVQGIHILSFHFKPCYLPLGFNREFFIVMFCTLFLVLRCTTDARFVLRT